MKKIFALIIAGLMVLSFAACGEKEGTTTDANESTSSEETTAAATVAASFVELFKAEASKEGATTNSIATAISTNEIVAFGPMVLDMEEGFLTGFNSEIKGFKACTVFSPMIGTIPFVSYVFELAADADVDAFTTTLKDEANLRWNVCTAAEEMLVEVSGNFVFFIMAPLSFEQEPVEDENGVDNDMGLEGGEADGPAAYDPEAESESEAEAEVA